MKVIKTLFVAVVWIAAQCAHAQSGIDMAAHVEIHQIPSLTLSDSQMLTGDRNGKAVTIAGILPVRSDRPTRWRQRASSRRGDRRRAGLPENNGQAKGLIEDEREM